MYYDYLRYLVLSAMTCFLQTLIRLFYRNNWYAMLSLNENLFMFLSPGIVQLWVSVLRRLPVPSLLPSWSHSLISSTRTPSSLVSRMTGSQLTHLRLKVSGVKLMAFCYSSTAKSVEGVGQSSWKSFRITFHLEHRVYKYMKKLMLKV